MLDRLKSIGAETRTLASLSAARWAYIVGCRETLSMFFAWGNDDREQDKLGRDINFSGATPMFGDA
jgi:hypothetical protein